MLNLVIGATPKGDGTWCNAEGGWNLVQRRRGRLPVRQEKDDPDTYFFRNFPDGCSEASLRRKFEEVGKVQDLFLPAKKDKAGKRFGFVRFTDKGKNSGRLERLNNIWIGSYIIRAYVPRFDRPTVRGGGRVEKKTTRKEGPSGKIASPEARRRRENLSFTDVVKGGSEARKRVSEVEDMNRKGKRHEVFQSLKEEGSWLQGAVTGRLKNEFLWKHHGGEIHAECVGKLKLSDLGDRLVLIQSEGECKTEEVIGGLMEWANFWFDWWRPWRSRDVNQKRIIWTKWTGVPLQAWTRRFFSWGCDDFGRVVEIHQAIESHRKLDAAFVRVITGLNSINMTKTCKIDEESFNIRIDEVCCMEKEIMSQRY